ncbi:MAG TPA: type II secretion system F family protein [Gaiellales bacterium]|nr:type II secretion system F family protein [Gaiellales bacterium]
MTHRSQARRERAVAGQMHLVAAELAAHVRAGRTLAQAIVDVAEDVPEPARSQLTVAAAAIRLGMSPTEALAGLRGGPDASVLASAVAVQLRVGGDLATLLDGLAEALVERDAQRRAAEVATAQARATARMVAAMPLVSVLGLALIDSSALAALLASPLGLGSLVASGAVTAAGLAVIGRLAAVAP